MGNDRSVRDAVRRLAGTFGGDTITFLSCSVSKVDISKRSCDCIQIGGDAVIEIPGVQLMSEVDDGWLLLPAIDSTVIVCYSNKNVPYIALFSEIDKAILIANNGIQLQGGEFGGLTKTIELQTQLNKTNELLTALLTVLNGSPINEPGNGAPSALQIALKASITGKQLGNYTDIINENITHGS